MRTKLRDLGPIKQINAAQARELYRRFNEAYGSWQRFVLRAEKYGDPVEHDAVSNEWSFWDETGTISYDGYASEEAARAALDLYCTYLDTGDDKFFRERAALEPFTHPLLPQPLIRPRRSADKPYDETTYWPRGNYPLEDY